MMESDSDLDLGNSAEEVDDDSEDEEDLDDLEKTDELSQKNLSTKSESCNLYTIPEEEEKGSKDSKNDSYISRLELYFKQLAECSNK